MEIVLAILRGINVSGHKIIKMAELKALLEKAGFEKVATYIQSGNIVFLNRHVPQAELTQIIAKSIYEQFNFEVSVVTRTMAEIENLLAQNPFLTSHNLNSDSLHVTFLADLPEPPLISKIPSSFYDPDKFIVQDRTAFLYCPNGYGYTKLTNTFFEKKLKVNATTRNWRTVNELYRIMKTY